MKFHSLTKEDLTDHGSLKARFDEGHQIGAVCVAKDHLFVRKGLKNYFIAYGDADRIFKRVRTVTANVCCEGGEFRFDYLVIHRNGEEILEVQLPGEKAGKILFDELRTLNPPCDLSAPEKPEAV